MTDDAELLRRYAEEKSDAAFAELVRRQVDFVYAAALRQTRGNAALAQDVAQAVFVDLAHKAKVLSRHDVLVGWLHTATRFAAAKAIRAERRRLAREQEAALMNDALHAEEAPADWERLQPVLDEVLGELKERERTAILLRFFEKRPFAEVGAKLALTETAARSCVDRGLEKMRPLLARRGVSSTAAALGLALSGRATAAAPAGLATRVTNAVLTGVAAPGGGAVVAVSILNLMSTTKTVGGIACVVVLVAVGTAIYYADSNRTLGESLASTTLQRDELRIALRGLENQMEVVAKQAREVDADNAMLLNATERILSIKTAQNPASNGPLTHGIVQAQYGQALALARTGDPAAALKGFLWCFDDGMARVSTFRVARRGALLDAIANLGKQYPEALQAMRVRRDEAERRLQDGAYELDSVADFIALNRVLEDPSRTIAQYDRLPMDDPRRGNMAVLAFEQLIAAQRYSDAALAKPFARMESQLELFSRDHPLPAGTPNLDEIQKSTRDFAVNTALNNIEALAGAGNLAQARRLVEKLLTYDHAEQIAAILRVRLARAGHPELLSERSRN